VTRESETLASKPLTSDALLSAAARLLDVPEAELRAAPNAGAESDTPTRFPLYAVIDGARFSDLPGLLFDHDMSHLPLYRDTGSESREVERTVPQFVRFDRWDHWENDLTPVQRLSNWLEVMHEAVAEEDEAQDVDARTPDSACVFWVHTSPAKPLFRHLRTINTVLIPRDENNPPPELDWNDPDTPEILEELDKARAAPDAPAGLLQDGGTQTHQSVLFRHADAGVIAQVTPELGQDRLARLLGPAHGLLCAPEEDWADPDWTDKTELMRVDNPGTPDTWSRQTPLGRTRLQLSERTMDRIAARREAVLRSDIIEFLRDMSPEETKTMEDRTLLKKVIEAERTADEIGISSKVGYEMWAYFALMTKGQSLYDPDVRAYFIASEPPNEKMDSLGRRLLELEKVTISHALDMP